MTDRQLLCETVIRYGWERAESLARKGEYDAARADLLAGIEGVEHDRAIAYLNRAVMRLGIAVATLLVRGTRSQDDEALLSRVLVLYEGGLGKP